MCLLSPLEVWQATEGVPDADDGSVPALRVGNGGLAVLGIEPVTGTQLPVPEAGVLAPVPSRSASVLDHRVTRIDTVHLTGQLLKRGPVTNLNLFDPIFLPM